MQPRELDSNCLQATYDSRGPRPRVQTNAELHREISAVVIREVLEFPEQTQMDLGPWHILDFSSVFSIDWGSGVERQGVFIKIPKVEIRKRQVGMVTPADRKFAGAEYDSLVRLAQAWDGADLGVSFVKPLAFLADYNAIVTQRAYGREFFALFRGAALRCRGRGPGADDPVLGCLHRLGRVLARYHRTCSEARPFGIEALRAKIRGYLARLQELQVAPAMLAQVDQVFASWRGRVAGTGQTDTIKGLDVRNILIDSQNRLFLLDAGKLKRDYQEADLARFLVTCRILYWGSPWFFLRLTPHRVYEQSFLQGYYGGAEPGDWVLTVFIIKELLKHWLMAYRAMGLKRWPRALKAVLKRTYIDPFYQEQIAVELQKLTTMRSGS